MVVEVAYAQGWDLAARALWGPLSAEAARERDVAGLPYVAAYRVPGREIPLEVRLVSWREHYVGLWVYDAQGRRTYDLDMRLLDAPGRLLRRHTVGWQYTGPEMAEFDKACPRITVELFPDGKGRRTEERQGEGGGTYVTVPTVRDDERWMERPAFGDWPVLSATVHGLTEPMEFRAAEAVAADAGEEPATCWRAPRPARPGPIDALFRPGTRMSTDYYPEMTVAEPKRCGTLRVPSGLLAVADPSEDDGLEITIAVPPGEYALEEARVTFGYDSEWTGGWVERTDTTAVRLRVSETPAASWEMAIGPDDDVRLLAEDGIFGFDTDGATGCFADAGAWEPLQQLFEKALVQGDPDAGEHLTDSMYILRTSDQPSGAELVASATCGDGTYPVWVGRSAAGEVVGVVVLVDGIPELAAP
ncbi:DUF4241 domain-containing protein [Streptomyces sp. APSN-46.1]|uniref:DUF4241 domain-containing protein n=1 Tax=Streptomyces sp. APSN-46.1 TaxID=2929049 RepID=UPI001FB56699|nr:DUF4241 domain-containing protein [Streptomyces sp. APSN-46.1]MCJ1679132.1 DUF4241 domain-containing protein [Streptomyces sp. APSN-46.1]